MYAEGNEPIGSQKDGTCVHVHGKERKGEREREKHADAPLEEKETTGYGRDAMRQTPQFSKVHPRSQEGQVSRYR